MPDEFKNITEISKLFNCPHHRILFYWCFISFGRCIFNSLKAIDLYPLIWFRILYQINVQISFKVRRCENRVILFISTSWPNWKFWSEITHIVLYVKFSIYSDDYSFILKINYLSIFINRLHLKPLHETTMDN